MIASTYWILITRNDVVHFYVVSHLTIQAPCDVGIIISIMQKKKMRLRKHEVIAQGHRADERWELGFYLTSGQTPAARQSNFYKRGEIFRLCLSQKLSSVYQSFS